MNKIRLALDASPLLLRSAGVKNYIYYWARGLMASAGENSLHLFPFLDRPGAFAHDRSVTGPLETIGRLALLRLSNSIPFPILNWFAPDVDIFHASYPLRHPPRRPRLTATIYDVTCWLMPEMHTPTNVTIAKQMAEWMFRPADVLIAISESTRSDAVRVLGIRPDKIEVIYPGVADAFFKTSSGPARETARRHGLEKPYALYVGTLEPRKNLHVLLDAWDRLQPDLRREFDLAIVGSWGWGENSVLDRLRSGQSGVRYLGYVAESDLPDVTAAASLFVYPSLYEGFGLPVAQAMAAGVPVITSNVSSLPEVTGDAALLVDPRSQSGLQTALERLLPSPALRFELAERGRERARQFTWTECARRSWKLFERVCGATRKA